MKAKRRKEDLDVPSIELLKEELVKEKYRRQYGSVVRSTVYTLITVAAIAILVATLWMPVLQVYGNSMTPALQDGDIVISVKSSNFQQGDIVAFYYNNKVLIKRVIASAGQWVDIDEEGTVYIDDAALDEPYLTEKALGDTNIVLPYQVPEGRIFVMGDHRSISVDSRNTAVGPIAQEQIVGKLVMRLWPLRALGGLE